MSSTVSAKSPNCRRYERDRSSLTMNCRSSSHCTINVIDLNVSWLRLWPPKWGTLRAALLMKLLSAIATDSSSSESILPSSVWAERIPFWSVSKTRFDWNLNPYYKMKSTLCAQNPKTHWLRAKTSRQREFSCSMGQAFFYKNTQSQAQFHAQTLTIRLSSKDHRR